MQRTALCRSRRELSNAYLLAKFGFDTAEKEPCKVCPRRCFSVNSVRAFVTATSSFFGWSSAKGSEPLSSRKNLSGTCRPGRPMRGEVEVKSVHAYWLTNTYLLTNVTNLKGGAWKLKCQEMLTNNSAHLHIINDMFFQFLKNCKKFRLQIVEKP